MPGGGTLDPWNRPHGPDRWISNPYRCQKYPADVKDRLEEDGQSISQPLKAGDPGIPPADPKRATTSRPKAHL